MNIKDRNKGDLWWLKHERNDHLLLKISIELKDLVNE
jgi:hypothetical protein